MLDRSKFQYRYFEIVGEGWTGTRLHYRLRPVWWNPATWFCKWRLYSELFAD